MEYEKVKQVVDNQQYSKAGIVKIISETATIEENMRKAREVIREVDKKIMEKRQEKRELEDIITKSVKKLNAAYAKVYGENGPQMKFDPEKTQVGQMLVCSINTLEQLEESQVSLLKMKKEELGKQEATLVQVKEEIKMKSRENEDSQKVNDQAKEEIAIKKKKLEEVSALEKETEEYYKKEIEKSEDIVRKTARSIEDLGKEVAALEDDSQKRKAFLDSLAEQRKKDRDETKKMVTDFVNEALGYKIEVTDDFDQIATAIHNANAQMQQNTTEFDGEDSKQLEA